MDLIIIHEGSRLNVMWLVKKSHDFKSWSFMFGYTIQIIISLSYKISSSLSLSLSWYTYINWDEWSLKLLPIGVYWWAIEDVFYMNWIFWLVWKVFSKYVKASFLPFSINWFWFICICIFYFGEFSLVCDTCGCGYNLELDKWGRKWHLGGFFS